MLIHLTDWGDLKSSLRPQHHAKAAKEEKYDGHEIGETNIQACDCKPNAEYGQGADGKILNRRIEEERHQSQTRCNEVS
jgi:hypothetical protein